jgi:hypothetical protein
MVKELTGTSFVTPEEMQADLAEAQAEHRKQGTRTDKLHYDVMKLKEGNSTAYLLRRLAGPRSQDG